MRRHLCSRQPPTHHVGAGCTISVTPPLAATHACDGGVGPHRPECMSLKPRQRPAKRAVIDMRAVMDKCADINAAAGCLQFLDEQEGEYTVPPAAGHPEASSVWTMMPLSPKPVRPCSAHRDPYGRNISRAPTWRSLRCSTIFLHQAFQWQCITIQPTPAINVLFICPWAHPLA